MSDFDEDVFTLNQSSTLSGRLCDIIWKACMGVAFSSEPPQTFKVSTRDTDCRNDAGQGQWRGRFALLDRSRTGQG